MRSEQDGRVYQPEPEDGFATALRAAVQARGLGLERIQERLRAEGVAVSLATLSYWQSGRSRPARRESLVTLAASRLRTDHSEIR